MSFIKVSILSIVLFSCLTFEAVKADTPANCTYEDVKGLWVFHEGSRGNSKQIQCDNGVTPISDYYVNLEFPNTATDLNGNVGFWTIIYNQGFEVVINNRKYFAFSYYTGDASNVTSFCDTTFWGWAHETGVNAADWSCYKGERADKINEIKPKTTSAYHKNLFSIEKRKENKLYKKNLEFVDQINKKQSSWTATHYEFMEKQTIRDVVRMAGGKKSRILSKPKPAPVDQKTRKTVESLPATFDWRNVSGVSYVSPIRNQKTCGSCYAFGSLAMNEARLRVKTLNAKTTVFSTQDIVECSEYSQGCDGGFPYLVGGKYTEDFGLVEESCNPYTGLDGECSTDKTCNRQYGTNYRYIGGFYGACNEPLMRIALVKDGPIAISFEVYDDFMNYKGGIYEHTGLKDNTNFGFNPFEITNHVVLIVGYGSEAGKDFWIVKNSWGTGWGENGFFRILRGADECAIESIAVESDVVV